MITTPNNNHNHNNKPATPISRHNSGPSRSDGFRRQTLPDHNHTTRLRPSIEARSASSGIPKARKKNKTEARIRGDSKQMLASQLFSTRPLKSQSAFKLAPCEINELLMLLLAILAFISLVDGVLALDESREELGKIANNRGRLKTADIHHRHRYGHGLKHAPPHLHRSTASKQQDQQQNRLRYLIAKTASIPHLDDPSHDGSPLYQPHRPYQGHASHRASNSIVSYYEEHNHPNSVQRRTSSEPSVTSAVRHHRHSKSFLKRDQPESTVAGIYSLDRPNSLYYDFDSLDVDPGDSDDGYADGDDDDAGRATNDDEDEDDEDDVIDDEDDGLDVGASSDIDVVEEGALAGRDDDDGSDKDDRVDANCAESVERPNDDSDISEAVQSEISSERHIEAKYQDQGDIIQSYSHPTTTPTKAHLVGSGNFGENMNKTVDNNQQNDSESQSTSGQLSDRPDWMKDHDDGSSSQSNHIIKTSVNRISPGADRRVSSHKEKPIPLAPYQSPVVVSISDNSFVSASPIIMGSDVEGAGGSDSFGEATVRYSHIIASPKNELSSHGNRHWHESHIQMIQEDPDELRRGNINSAIIAVLFGIGATGMLIMIVSVKMRSIRERVAYKGRRRSLVPDTDFLINTIPI